MKKHSPAYSLAALFSVVVLVALDQWTKFLAVKYLKDNASKTLIPGVLEFAYVENRGMAFSLMQNQRLFFLISTTIILIVLIRIYFCLPAEKKYRPLSIVIVLIVAGAVGNLIDRVRLGYVVDFIYISLINFPVFNVADCYVTWTAVAAAVLVTFRYTEEDIKKIRLL